MHRGRIAEGRDRGRGDVVPVFLEPLQKAMAPTVMASSAVMRTRMRVTNVLAWT